MRKPIIWTTAVAGAVVLIGAGAAVAVAATSTPTAVPSAASSTTSSDDGSGPDATPGPSTAFASDIEGAIAAALAEAGPGTVVDADIDDDLSHAYEIDIRLDDGGFVEVKLDRDLNIVRVSNDDSDSERDDDGRDGSRDDSSPDGDAVTDVSAFDEASAAALAHVGAGTVVSVEYSDDVDHLYEVEIDFGNGEDVDVELDAQFAVVEVD